MRTAGLVTGLAAGVVLANKIGRVSRYDAATEHGLLMARCTVVIALGGSLVALASGEGTGVLFVLAAIAAAAIALALVTTRGKGPG